MTTVAKRTYNTSQKVMDATPIRPTRPPKGNGTMVITYSGGSLMVRPFVVHELIMKGIVNPTETDRTYHAPDDDKLWEGLRGSL